MVDVVQIAELLVVGVMAETGELELLDAGTEDDGLL
jgi:hypothetical protein